MSLRNLQLIPDLPFKVKQIIDITDTLPSRTPDPEPVRTPEQITYISIHHSGVEGGTIQGYADYHVNTKKWYHIGYHVVVKGDQPYQTNDLLTFSYHTSSHNYNTVSASVSADLSKRPMSEVERNALYGVVLTYMSQFNIPVENVWGHDEFPDNKTDCPCIDMNKMRNDLRTIQNQMAYLQSAANKKSVALSIANQLVYQANLALGKDAYGNPATPGNIEYGTNMIMELKQFMDERGLKY